MRSMAGGDYGRSLRMTFLPELVSMNAVMAGMAALSVPWLQHLTGPGPGQPSFWFVMSMSLTLGFVVAYPMNWWLVAAGLKHGMLTVRPDGAPVPLAAGLALVGAAVSSRGGPEAAPPRAGHAGAVAGATAHAGDGGQTTNPGNRGAKPAGRARSPRIDKVSMTSMSFAILTLGLIVAGTLGSLNSH